MNAPTSWRSPAPSPLTAAPSTDSVASSACRRVKLRCGSMTSIWSESPRSLQAEADLVDIAARYAIVRQLRNDAHQSLHRLA